MKNIRADKAKAEQAIAKKIEQSKAKKAIRDAKYYENNKDKVLANNAARKARIKFEKDRADEEAKANAEVLPEQAKAGAGNKPNLKKRPQESNSVAGGSERPSKILKGDKGDKK